MASGETNRTTKNALQNCQAKRNAEFSVEGLSGYWDTNRQLFVADEIGGVDVVEWPSGLVKFFNVPVDIAYQAVSRTDTILFLQLQGFTEANL
jgi:hypothetical protein